MATEALRVLFRLQVNKKTIVCVCVSAVEGVAHIEGSSDTLAFRR